MADLHYVYAIVPATLDVAAAPSGLDDAPVRAIRERDGAASPPLAAIVSPVNAAQYSALDDRLADLAWLGPRARAHDAVVTWASDKGAVVPLPMFSLFLDEDRVRDMLAERRAQLARALARTAQGREYTVRVFRIDGEVEKRVGVLSERVRELEEQAAKATPGQRYLLERKLEGERRAEARRVGGEVARESYESLAALSLGATTDALPASTPDSAAGTAILNGAFLVARDGLEPFQRALTALVAHYEPNGFRFEFTGPWPPYHFVEEHA